MLSNVIENDIVRFSGVSVVTVDTVVIFEKVTVEKVVVGPTVEVAHVQGHISEFVWQLIAWHQAGSHGVVTVVADTCVTAVVVVGPHLQGHKVLMPTALQSRY